MLEAARRRRERAREGVGGWPTPVKGFAQTSKQGMNLNRSERLGAEWDDGGKSGLKEKRVGC